MGASRNVDLDAFLAEANEEPVTVTYRGRQWELHTSLPLGITLQVLSAVEDGRGQDDLTLPEQVAMLKGMVPAEVLDEWQKLGMGTNEFAVLLPRLIALYMGNAEDGDDDLGEAEAPAQTGGSDSS